MEQYKKKLQTRIAVLAFGTAALLALLVLTQVGIISTVSTQAFSYFLRGAELGLLVTIIIFFTYLMVRFIKLLGNEDKLKKQYYEENDERTRLIMLKIGGSAMYVCAVVILLAGLTAGYFNATVFFSLTGCAAFLLFVRAFLKLYYNNKF